MTADQRARIEKMRGEIRAWENDNEAGYDEAIDLLGSVDDLLTDLLQSGEGWQPEGKLNGEKN